MIQTIEDPVDWIEAEFFIPEAHGPIRLEPYQRAVLREAYRRDERGHFVYSIVLWSDIKKSGKSSVAAAVALERSRRTPYGSVKIVANDLKQADSRVAFYARRAIDLNTRLGEQVKVKPSGYMLEFPNRARIEAIPVDPRGEAGGNDDLIIFSELWAANQKAAQLMWTEMTLSPTKFGQSQRWVETYAGYSGESPLLERLYEQGVKESRHLDLSYTDADGVFHDLSDLEVYANAEARMLCLWNTVPRCAWQTEEYYAQERATLLPGEFSRVHENKWSTSVEAFVPDGWWDDCEDADACASTANPVVIALDAAISGDSFAVVVVTRDKGICFVKGCRVWYPPPNGKIDFADIEKHVRDLKGRYIVREFAYDQYQLHDMATRLYGKLGFWRAFPQGQDRLVADKALYDLIRDRKIRHAGEIDLAEHIANANAAKEGDKLRIEKRSQNKKIDAAVALSMACSRATYYRIGGEA